MPIQSLVDLTDARAKAPGTQTQQNPLDAKLLGQADVPVGNALKLPGPNSAFHLGAANQVAVARTTGYAYGASGAVANSGAVSSGGDDSSYPANANIELSSADVGSTTIPGLPAGASLPSGANPGSVADLGAVTAGIGAVSAIAKTNTGGALAKPDYQIADLDLDLSSPALAALLKQLAAGGKQLEALLNTVSTNLPVGSSLPAQCVLTPGQLPSSKLTLDSGAVTVDASSGAITVSVSKLLQQAGLDLNDLAPNTDLLALVLNELPTVLSKGLESVVNGIVNPIQAIGSKCLGTSGALATLVAGLPSPAAGALATALSALTGTSGESAIETAVNSIADMLGTGSSGLSALTDQLANVADIGVNVQQGAYPLSSESKPKYKYTSGLEATPDQATPEVDNQAIVRALEIDLLNTGAVSGSGKTPAASLALANGAVSTDVVTAASNSASPENTATALPTGVPAGQALHGGPSTPSVLLAVLATLALLLAGGGTLAYRRRAGVHR